MTFESNPLTKKRLQKRVFDQDLAIYKQDMEAVFLKKMGALSLKQRSIIADVLEQETEAGASEWLRADLIARGLNPLLITDPRLRISTVRGVREAENEKAMNFWAKCLQPYVRLVRMYDAIPEEDRADVLAQLRRKKISEQAKDKLFSIVRRALKEFVRS